MEGKENNNNKINDKINKEVLEAEKYENHITYTALIIILIILLPLLTYEIFIFVVKFNALMNSNDLEEGDYIEYDVEYKDAYTDVRYTKNTGWRVCNPGKQHLDGTYSGVELISTGVPMRLYYDSDKIVEADGVRNYPWKINPNSQEMKKLRETQRYSPDVYSSPGGMAAGGLRYNFAKMKVLPDDPGEKLRI